MEIRIATRNLFKVSETKSILKGSKIKIIPVDLAIEELQTLDVMKLVKDKLMKAFSKIGRPLIVEHTGLYIEYLNNFPGGLTQIFWDSLQADKFADIVGNLPDTRTVAKTIVGYCDGKTMKFFEGQVHGNISNIPRGNREFQWDCVFIPKGEKLTFSEMGLRKNQISMRKVALEAFRDYITKL